MYDPVEKAQVAELHDAFRILRENKRMITEALRREHRTNQQALMREIIVPSIKHWAYCKEEEIYDLRNEATVTTCKKIVESVEDLDYLPFI